MNCRLDINENRLLLPSGYSIVTFVDETQNLKSSISSVVDAPQTYQDSDHRDQMKSVTDVRVTQTLIEVADAYTGIIKTAKTIINLFAGNCNDTIAVQNLLTRDQNTQCSIMAVDKSAPNENKNVDLLRHNLGERFKFIEQNALFFLQSLPSESTDLITIVGADYYFLSDPTLKDLYLNEVWSVLKIGGVLVAPSFQVENLGSRWKQLGFASLQKIDAGTNL